MSTLGATLAAFSMLVYQSNVVAVSEREFRPDYHKIDYESACGSTVFRVRFRNGLKERGRVDQVLIDRRPVRGAAETLQILAARRAIAGFEIMDCGMDPLRPIFRGVMVLSEGESQAAGMRNMIFFRLSRHGRDWQIALD